MFSEKKKNQLREVMHVLTRKMFLWKGKAPLSVELSLRSVSTAGI